MNQVLGKNSTSTLVTPGAPTNTAGGPATSKGPPTNPLSIPILPPSKEEEALFAEIAARRKAGKNPTALQRKKMAEFGKKNPIQLNSSEHPPIIPDPNNPFADWCPISVLSVYGGENSMEKEVLVIRCSNGGQLSLAIDECFAALGHEKLQIKLVFNWNPKPVILGPNVRQVAGLVGGHPSMHLKGSWNKYDYPIISIPASRVAKKHLPLYKRLENEELMDFVTRLSSNTLRIVLPLAPGANVHKFRLTSKVSELDPAESNEVSKKTTRLKKWYLHASLNRLWKIDLTQYKSPDDPSKPFELIAPGVAFSTDPQTSDAGYYTDWSEIAKMQDGHVKEFYQAFVGTKTDDDLNALGERIKPPLGWSKLLVHKPEKLNKLKVVGPGDLDVLIGYFIMLKYKEFGKEFWEGSLIIGCIRKKVIAWTFSDPYRYCSFVWRDSVKAGNVRFVSKA